MASFIAKNATIVFVGSAIASMCLTDVTITVTGATDSFTCMASEWQTTLAASKSWTASWTTKLDSTAGIDLSNTVGVSASLTMDTVDGLSYAGTAIIETADISADTETTSTVSWSAIGSGALVEA